MTLFPSPIFPYFVSYLVGLVFYATHFSECLLAAHTRTRPTIPFGLGLISLEWEAMKFGTGLSFWQLANTEMR